MRQGPKQERRYRRTEALILSGFTKLLQEKSVKDITVRELADLVDINRSTFYLHYADIYDLLEKTEKRLLEQIRSAVDDEWGGAYTYTPENFYLFLEKVFTILTENPPLFAALMSPHGDIAFLSIIESEIREKGIETIQSFAAAQLRENDLQYAISLELLGCMGLIAHWLQKGCPESPTHMARLAFLLMREGISSIEIEGKLDA